MFLFTLFTWHKLKMFEKKHEKHTLRAFLKKNKFKFFFKVEQFKQKNNNLFKKFILLI